MKTINWVLAFLLLAGCGDSDNLTGSGTATSALSDLQSYANTVVQATGGEVNSVSVEPTTREPMYAFQIRFMTTNDALMSDPNARPGNAAYLTNVGRTKAWSTRFCTPELKAIMERHAIDMVTGNLTDTNGDTQSMSIC